MSLIGFPRGAPVSPTLKTCAWDYSSTSSWLRWSQGFIVIILHLYYCHWGSPWKIRCDMIIPYKKCFIDRAHRAVLDDWSVFVSIQNTAPKQSITKLPTLALFLWHILFSRLCLQHCSKNLWHLHLNQYVLLCVYDPAHNTFTSWQHLHLFTDWYTSLLLHRNRVLALFKFVRVWMRLAAIVVRVGISSLGFSLQVFVQFLLLITGL